MIVGLQGNHIREVIDNLSDQSLAEMKVVGVPQEEILPRFLRFMMTADRAEGHAYLDETGKAICAMAVADHEGIVSSFMLGGKGFFETSRRRIRPFREYMAWMVKRFGPIYVFSYSPHPDANRWLKMIGGAEFDMSDANRKVYRWG